MAWLEVWPIDTYNPNFVNFGPGVPRYHGATFISPSLMHLLNILLFPILTLNVLKYTFSVIKTI